MAGNVVEIVVQSKNDSAAGFDEAKAQADESAAAFDEYGAAIDRAAAAEADFAAKSAEQDGALARLNELQQSGTASADELAAAQDRLTTATLASFDAQIKLTGAMADMDAKQAVAAGATEEQGAADEDAAGSSGLLAGAYGAAKLALLGLAGAAVYGTVKAAGFQSIMTTLSTQAGVARGQLAALGNGILSLAGQVGFAPDSLATALYHVESSFASVGITGPKALDLLKTAAEGAAVGHANLTDVTNALDATIVSGVPGIKSYSGAMGELNAIVGAGDMTMQDLAEAMGTGVMGVAKSYGQSISQVGAALAVFGDNNIRGAKAATDLRMAWQAMMEPVATGIPLLQKIGLTSQQLGDTMEHHGLSAAIGQFIQHLQASKVPADQWGQMMTQIFGKKAGVGIGILVDQFSRLQSKFPDLEKGASGFGNAWKHTNATVGQQWNELKAALSALVTKLGDALLPTAMRVVHAVTDFANALVLVKGQGPAMALAGVVGTLLAGVALNKLQNGLQSAAEGFQGLWQAGEKVAGWIGGLIGKLGLATAAQDEQTAATEEGAVAQGELDAAMDANPIGLIVLAIAALIAIVVLLITHWHTVEDAAKDVWHAVVGAFGAVLSWVKSNWPLLLGIFLGPFGEIIGVIIKFHAQILHLIEDAWHDVVSATHQAWSDVVSFLHSVWSDIVSGLHTAWSDLVNAIHEGWSDAVNFTHSAWSEVVSFLHSVWSDIVNDVSNGIHDIVSWFESLPGRISSALANLPSLLYSAGVHAIEGLIHGIESMAGDVGHAVSSIASKVAGFFGLSPAKEGPLSGGGAPFIRGQHFAMDLAAGMASARGSVSASASRLAGGMAPAGAGGGHGAGAPVEITIEFHAGANGLSQEFFTQLANGIRVRGGSPQVVTKKVVLA